MCITTANLKTGHASISWDKWLGMYLRKKKKTLKSRTISFRHYSVRWYGIMSNINKYTINLPQITFISTRKNLAKFNAYQGQRKHKSNFVSHFSDQLTQKELKFPLCFKVEFDCIYFQSRVLIRWRAFAIKCQFIQSCQTWFLSTISFTDNRGGVGSPRLSYEVSFTIL